MYFRSVYIPRTVVRVGPSFPSVGVQTTAYADNSSGDVTGGWWYHSTTILSSSIFVMLNMLQFGTRVAKNVYQNNHYLCRSCDYIISDYLCYWKNQSILHLMINVPLDGVFLWNTSAKSLSLFGREFPFLSQTRIFRIRFLFFLLNSDSCSFLFVCSFESHVITF